MTTACVRDHDLEQQPGDNSVDLARAARLILAYLVGDEQTPSHITAESARCVECLRGVAWAAAGLAGAFAERAEGGSEKAAQYVQLLAARFLDKNP